MAQRLSGSSGPNLADPHELGRGYGSVARLSLERGLKAAGTRAPQKSQKGAVEAARRAEGAHSR